MKKSEMVCTKCIKYLAHCCRAQPVPVRIPQPAIHWCGLGLWHASVDDDPSEYHQFFWGDWYDEGDAPEDEGPIDQTEE